jgi:hypothetical protein
MVSIIMLIYFELSCFGMVSITMLTYFFEVSDFGRVSKIIAYFIVSGLGTVSRYPTYFGESGFGMVSMALYATTCLDFVAVVPIIDDATHRPAKATNKTFFILNKFEVKKKTYGSEVSG